MLENEEIALEEPTLPTLIAGPLEPPEVDGENWHESEASLPAATTTWIPAAVAALMAASMTEESDRIAMLAFVQSRESCGSILPEYELRQVRAYLRSIPSSYSSRCL